MHTLCLVKNARDLRVYHDLKPRSFLQAIGNFQKMHSFCL